jgi:hypothetical protein
MKVHRATPVLTGSRTLQVRRPLAMLTGLPQLATVDLRSIHDDRNIGYWSDAKCASMRHLSALTKALKRRPYPTRVLMDVD